MKRILFILTLLLPLSLSAQRIHAYVTSGVSLSQIEGDELKGFRQAGFTGGVGALTALDKHYRWGLSIEALFSQRGAYNRSADPYAANIALNYIDIPLLIHYQDPYGGMLVGVGLNYGRLVEQPHFQGEINKKYFLPDTSDYAFNLSDLAVVADARFTIWRGLQFNLRWQYSIIPIKRDWHFTEYEMGRWREWSNNCYNHSLSFRLIWQF